MWVVKFSWKAVNIFVSQGTSLTLGGLASSVDTDLQNTYLVCSKSSNRAFLVAQ